MSATTTATQHREPAAASDAEAAPLLGDAAAGGGGGAGTGAVRPTSAERDAALRVWLTEKGEGKEEGKTAGGGPAAAGGAGGGPGGLAAGMSKSNKYILGTAYMLAMGVCGIVLVALGSTLDDLAEDVGRTSVQLGSVFVARGVGAVAGAICSAKLYFWFMGNTVMVCALVSLALLLLGMPFITSDWVLHVVFLLLGLGTAITDTGCQIMTRKVHGKEAGPWLGANTVVFGISGALVPVVELVTDSMIVQYVILATTAVIVAVILLAVPNPETKSHGPGDAQNKDFKPPPRQDPPHYNVEWVLSFMVFWLIGGKVTATAYLEDYVSDTGIIPYSDSSLLITVLWVAITLGRLAGLQDQRFLTTSKLYNHLSVILLGGVVAMALVLIFPQQPSALWIGIFFYGLFNGPCVGYCYDLNNRITVATEKGMSIVMFGLNFGASLVPYATSLVWEGLGPNTCTVSIFLSMLLPIPLLHFTKRVSYDPQVNPNSALARAVPGRGNSTSSARSAPPSGAAPSLSAASGSGPASSGSSPNAALGGATSGMAEHRHNHRASSSEMAEV